MVDFDDTVALKRELVGETMSVCGLCHRPVAAASLVPATGSARLGEPDDILQICSDCESRIAAGDLTFEDAVAAGLEEADE
jgi:hypothetical protein